MKHSCLNGRSAKSMLWHLALIYLVVTLYLANELLDIFSNPLIYLIWDSDLYNAHIVSDYIHFIVVAVINFILALALMYFFSKMSSVIDNREFNENKITHNPFLTLRQAFEEST
jgi:hypothetical protein